MDPRPAPSYRLHRPTGLAVTTLEGRDRYLGPWRSPESLEAYTLALRTWARTDGGPTIAELSSRYRDHAALYYRRADGTQTGEATSIARSLRETLSLYGSLPARDFTLAALKLVRHAMIEAGLSRKVVNQRVGRVKRMFRWAAAEELLPATVFVKLSALPGLRAHRSPAKEYPDVAPVSAEHVEATLPFLSPVLRAMVEAQLVAGMRPGEVVSMRRAEMDVSTDPWCWRPAAHKTSHLGFRREVWLGRRAQAILAPFLLRPPDSFLFSPVESAAWWRARKREARRSPLTPSQLARTPKPDPKRAPRERFDVSSFDRAIARACKKADVPRWSANQLRHAAATRVEGDFGLEAAAAMLGHRKLETTQVYAKGKSALARKVAAERG